MKVLLVSGLSWPTKGIQYANGTLFDRQASPGLARGYFRQLHGCPVDLTDLYYTGAGKPEPLLRPREESVPHLTTSVLQSILDEHGHEFLTLTLHQLWKETWPSGWEDCDVICLSTTFICNEWTMSHVLERLEARLPDATLIMGGQYSNLKYRAILKCFSFVRYVITGDGEEALPALLSAIDRGAGLADVPNLATRDVAGEIRHTGTRYIPLDSYPSPRFTGRWPIVPYESMRGCPFQCRYCSYPHASPEWRYKSADKIAADWRAYRDTNLARHIKAMDSTFTVPPKRIQRLLQILPEVGVSWEAYSRSNVIRDARTVEAFREAGCSELSIGFESMSDVVLGYMHKAVKAEDNRRAAELLHGSGVRLRVCVMVGYPGETPDDYGLTHDYLVNEFADRCMLSPFSFIDETMPVWQDFERFRVEIDSEDPRHGWKHCGMDIDTARSLLAGTLDAMRWRNETGLMLLWQMDYQSPLVPGLSEAMNQRIEKLIERFAFLPKDYPDPFGGAERKYREILGELNSYGVVLAESSRGEANRLSGVDSIWIDFI